MESPMEHQDHQFHTGEGQDERYTVFDKTEEVVQALQHKIKAPQAQYRADIGSINNKRITGDRKDGRDGVDSEDDIRAFNQHQNCQ